MVQIISQESKWFLICGKENRFVYDIARAARKLVLARCSIDNIYYFSDCPDTRNILNAKDLSTEQLYSLQELPEILKKQEGAAFIGCVVSSHGDISGIEGTLRPSNLIESISSLKTVTDSLILLGQCYSGVFNCPKESNICIIGASGFYPSISSTGINDVDWSANVFIYYFFEWIGKPVDVDGDNLATVSDAYKYASYYTNTFMMGLKMKLSRNFDEWCTKEHQKIEELHKEEMELAKAQNISEAQMKLLERKGKEGQLLLNLQIYHTHQEPWIENTQEANRLIMNEMTS